MEPCSALEIGSTFTMNEGVRGQWYNGGRMSIKYQARMGYECIRLLPPSRIPSIYNDGNFQSIEQFAIKLGPTRSLSS